MTLKEMKGVFERAVKKVAQISLFRAERFILNRERVTLRNLSQN